MNSNFNPSPQDELEARITALLLGELPPDEAAALERQIANDAELRRLHDELKATIPLLREAMQAPAADLKLSPERWAKLTESFQIIPAQELEKERETESLWRTWLTLAAMVVGLLTVAGLFLLPSLAKAKSKSMVAIAVDDGHGLNLITPKKPVMLERPEAEWHFATPAEKKIDRAKIEKKSPDNPQRESLARLTDEAPAKAEDKLGEMDSPKGGTVYLPGLQETRAEAPISTPLASLSSADTKSLDARSKDMNSAFGIAQSDPALASAPAAVAQSSETGQGLHFEATKTANAGDSFFTTGGAGPSQNEGANDSIGFSSPAEVQGQQQQSRPASSTVALGVETTPKPAANGPASAGRIPGGFGGFGELGGSRVSRGYGGFGGGNYDALKASPPSGPANPTTTDMYRRELLADSELEKTQTPPAKAHALKTEPEEESAGADQQMGGGGMGGSPNQMSMRYYMSNPELMKRYFPQMYAQMQQQKEKKDADAPTAVATPAPVATTTPHPATSSTVSPPVYVPPMAMNARGASRPLLPIPPRSDGSYGQQMPMRRGGMDPASNTSANQNFQESRGELAQSTRPMERTPQQAGIEVKQKEMADLKAEAPVLGRPVLQAQDVTKLAAGAEDLETRLAEAERIRSSLSQQVSNAENEVSAPKSSPVQVIDMAEALPGEKSSFLQSLRGGVEKIARLEASASRPMVSSLLQNQTTQSYDPYFLQTEFEMLRSQRTLKRVIDRLNLAETWSREAGRKLTDSEVFNRLRDKIQIETTKGQDLFEIKVRDQSPQEAARIANAVVSEYSQMRAENAQAAKQGSLNQLHAQLADQERTIERFRSELQKKKAKDSKEEPVQSPAPKNPAPIPQPEVSTTENAFSTFSLNVSDVSFKLAAATLDKGLMPDAGSIRSEEFINAFDYRDPEAVGAPVAFAWERARYPFAQDREVLRMSLKTAASGRQADRPLNLVLLMDNSGSMERADRVQILRECLRVLAAQLQPQDRVSVVAFARTARLVVDGLTGTGIAELPERVGALAPEGGTNLEEAMRVAYQTARRLFLARGVNRIVLLTDGAANLGDVQPDSLKQMVEAQRRTGIALDCFGIGWDGLNDDLLETLSRNGDGRYGFVNTPEAATTEFAAQLAGALKIAAADVKVQVEFNPKRVTIYRQVGYAKHQLTKEQFRDNTVDAAELGAAEAGNAIYVVQVNPRGEGPLGTVRARFKVPGTNDYREHAWTLDYEGAARPVEESSYALRLATTASAFSEWLASSPYAMEVTADGLLRLLTGAPEYFAGDPRPKQLESMIRQVKSIAGK